LLPVEQFSIDTVEAHGVSAAGKRITLGVRMIEIQDAPLRNHGIEVEVLLQPFPQLQRPFVECCIWREQVIGADNRCIPADVAGADITLLEHRDVSNAVLFGKIISGCQSMPAATDDNRVIGGLRLRVTPGRFPMGVTRKCILNERSEGIAHFELLEGMSYA